MIDVGDEGGGLYLGIEIGGTKLQIHAGNRRAQILERIGLKSIPPAGAAGIRSQLESTIPDLARRLQARRHRRRLWRAGGLADGQICCSHQIEGWSDFPLGDVAFAAGRARLSLWTTTRMSALWARRCMEPARGLIRFFT